jgi:RNA polymerase-interacting CarD/CdnL/TRCF family regulator
MPVRPLTQDRKPLAHNRRLLQQVRRRLARYERRYELASDQLAAALASGRLRDTAEVCRWLIDYETYQALRSERTARLE